MTDHKPPIQEILIVGNYLPDRQESMWRFSRMLSHGLQTRGVAANTLTPGVWFGRLSNGSKGLGKWLAYLDKYLIFPWVLRRRVRTLSDDAVVHIADHSNAVYVPAARSAGHRVVVTCHDLGAVRGALGEETDCPATRMGKILQNWIARSLGKADLIVCVSTATKLDVERLIRRPDGRHPRTRLVLNGLNAAYSQMDRAMAKAQVAKAISGQAAFEPNAPFVLNVGSSLSRKNRGGVMRIFARVKDQWPDGRLVFAGEALTPDERKLAGELGLTARIIECTKPSDSELESLYNLATCLLFPSKFEGFGWPAIEAQACGCPVLCSDAGSLGEVVEASAFVRPFADEVAFAGEILRLVNDDRAIDQWRAAGLRNIKRFQADSMIDKYCGLYGGLNHQSFVKQGEEAILSK